MQNPSYLIRSRHAIYYFRYPVANHSNGKISVSLNTRCPKEALRLSKILEYHAFMVMSKQKIKELDYIEVKEILRNHFALVLENAKAKIDKDGALTRGKVNQWLGLQEQVLQTIRYDEDEIGGFMFDTNEDIPEESRLDKKLEPIAIQNDITDKGSSEYKAMRKEYKHALNSYISALLAHNDSSDFYDYAPSNNNRPLNGNKRNNLKLGCIVNKYISEIEGSMGKRSFDDQHSSMRFLIEVLGEGFLIANIEDTHVHKVRNMLMDVPKNRNKMPQTIGLSLVEQIESREKHDLERMSDTNINKYLGHMRALFNWAKESKSYSGENPFQGVKVKREKKGKRKSYIDKKDIPRILNELSAMDRGKALELTRYWGAMILIYTGARLNEIASLTPDDIRYDGELNVWYFSITDEEESKRTKNTSSIRNVPVHSKLIELGLLEYVEHARSVINRIPETNGYPTRLLYNLSYTDNGWGRKIGSWFNGKNGVLTTLGIKTKKVSLHSLRHSFITYLSVKNVEFAHIRAIVGHEGGTVAERKYVHYDLDHLPAFKEAVEKLPY